MKKPFILKFDNWSNFAVSVKVHLKIQMPQTPMGGKDGENIQQSN